MDTIRIFDISRFFVRNDSWLDPYVLWRPVILILLLEEETVAGLC